tara:strand:- start:338 stop:1222 length:885 start_codon:yes stop_codon:yes gene_type:complete
MKSKIIIGTRGSELALRQAEIVRHAIEKYQPNVAIEIKIIKTEGDSNQNPIPLYTVGKGWFTKEIEKELLAQTIDLAAHSLKDLPEVLPPGLCISAYLDREDSRDVLVSKENKTLGELAKGAIVGTDSIRRKVQILALRDDLVVESIRGNVLTRIEKLDAGMYDAVVLAYAGIKRLGIEDRINQYFSSNEVMPAPGQGILVIETREGDTTLNTLMQEIGNSEATYAAIAERSFSHALGGGCKMPVGACAKLKGDTLILEGMFADESGTLRYDTIEGQVSEAKELGIRLAQKIRT